MPELEDRLASLGASIEWPRTPEIKVFGVRPDVSREARRIGWPRWALAAAAALLVLATLLVYTPTREAIAGWLNLHTIIQRVPNPPSPSPRPSAALGSHLDLGTPVTLDEAQHTGIDWAIAVPSSLGAPDAVYLKLPPDGPSQGEVSLVYATRPGIPVGGTTGVAVLITEARGTVNEVYFQKMLGAGATLETITVAGHKGYWISGSPHLFLFVDADGNVVTETLRLATNTLIVDDGGTIVRIEADVTKQQALAMATSMR